MNRRRVTSHDVARLAGVSRATVSYVLNDVKTVNISDKTSNLVRSVAKDLGYVPDANAKALVKRRTEIVGLVLSRDYHQHLASNVFLPQFIDGLMDIVQQHKLRLLIDTVEDRTEKDAYMKLARSKQIDGMIFFNPRLDDTEFQALVEDGMSSVVVGHIPAVNITCVDVDNTAGAYKGVKHLLDLGHKRIGFIANAPESFASASERFLGYKQALQEHHIEIDETLIGYGKFSSQSGYDAMRKLFKARQDATAFFIASDEVAFGAITALRDHGFCIPEDVSIVGFDDVPASAYFHPALTTIRIPPFDMGQKSGELLIKLMSNQLTPGSQSILETTLVKRNSTCEPKQN